MTNEDVKTKMLSSEFGSIFDNYKNLKKHYSGCYSSDNLPKTLKPYHFIICNTDISSGEGKHWFAYVRTSRKEVCNHF